MIRVDLTRTLTTTQESANTHTKRHLKEGRQQIDEVCSASLSRVKCLDEGTAATHQLVCQSVKRLIVYPDHLFVGRQRMDC